MIAPAMFRLDVNRIQKLEVVDTIRGYSPISSSKGTITRPPPMPKSPAHKPVNTAYKHS